MRAYGGMSVWYQRYSLWGQNDIKSEDLSSDFYILPYGHSLDLFIHVSFQLHADVGPALNDMSSAYLAWRTAGTQPSADGD